MKGFGSAGIAFFIIAVLFLVYLFGNLKILEQNPVETTIYSAKSLLDDQNRTYYYAKEGIIAYCNEFAEYQNITLKSSVEGCNISLKGFKTKNCIFEMLNITHNFFSSAEITNSTLELNLNEYKYLMGQNGYNCNYDINEHNIEGCNAERTFEIICYSPYEIESDIGYQIMEFKVRGGAS